MSVINQMLRDLEKRKLKETSSGHYIDDVNIVAKRTISPWWIILPLMICIVVAIYFYLHFLNKNKLTSTSTAVQSEITLSVTESTIQDLPEKVADIKPETKIKPFKEDVNKNNKPVAEIVIKQSQKPVPEIPDKLVPETKDKTNKQLPESEPILSRSVANNSSIKEQRLKEKKNSDNSALNAPVKLPVKIQSIRLKKSTLINAEKVIYQARLLMADDQAEAVQLLENNLNKVSPNADYYALLANLKQRKHNYDNAIIYYRKALDIAPDKGEIWIGIALAYQGAGEEQNAINAFKQALVLDDLSVELRAFARQQIGL